MDSFRFLTWPVYKDAKSLFQEVLNVIDSLPKDRQIQLGNQLIRSAQSVVLNIAEGSGKTSDKELNRFFEIALGSLYETLAGLDLLKESGLLREAEFIRLQTHIDSVCKQLGGFKKKIRSGS